MLLRLLGRVLYVHHGLWSAVVVVAVLILVLISAAQKARAQARGARLGRNLGRLRARALLLLDKVGDPRAQPAIVRVI